MYLFRLCLLFLLQQRGKALHSLVNRLGCVHGHIGKLGVVAEHRITQRLVAVVGWYDIHRVPGASERQHAHSICVGSGDMGNACSLCGGVQPCALAGGHCEPDWGLWVHIMQLVRFVYGPALQHGVVASHTHGLLLCSNTMKQYVQRVFDNMV